MNVPQKIEETKEPDAEQKKQGSEETKLRQRGKAKAVVETSEKVEDTTNASDGHEDDEENGADDKQ